MKLPVFKYHPDPVATGMITSSEKTCVVCNQARGYLYTSISYSSEMYEDSICPWCIADGSAHRKFNATFVDEAGIGGYGKWEKVSDKITADVSQRTPCFHSWQSEQWFTHCGDAGAFIAVVGYAELRIYGEQAIEAVRASMLHDGGEDYAKYIESLHVDGMMTGYLFRCFHCGQYGGYADSL